MISAARQDPALAVVGVEDEPSPGQRLSGGYIALYILAQAALFVAWIAPVSFTLAVRIEQLDAAAKDTALALAIGIPGVAILVTGPLLGVLSDRTRSRLGRRRPWIIAGTALGVLGSVVVGLAPSVAVVVLGWIVAYIGFAAVGNLLLVHLGDKLPEDQRGKVAGLAGAVTQIAPIIGVVLAGALTAAPLLMFLVPAVIAVLGLGLFVLRMQDVPLQGSPAPVDIAALARGFWFDPRRHPALAWVWISRAMIFLALSFFSVYGVYLAGERLDLDPAGVAGLVATAGILGVLVGVIGALGSGWLSDRLQQRKPFLLGSALVIAAGMLVVSGTASIGQYIVGSLITVFGIGVYGAVDQATLLDVLPEEEGENGRYLGIANLANQMSQGVGPFIAGGLLLVVGGDYTWVYVAGAVAAVVGAALLLPLRLPDRRSVPSPG